jgi:hypothetical protein
MEVWLTILATNVMEEFCSTDQQIALLKGGAAVLVYITLGWLM